jgi:uncharacterized protein YkwD
MFSPRRVVTLVVTLATVALATPAGAQAADCAGADVVPDAGNLTQVGQATLCLLNSERGAQGMGPLAEATGLTQPSHAYSGRMVAENFFAHESPDGGSLVDRLVAAGYVERGGDWTVGENIAWGQGELATPRSIVAAWMASPGHRANVLTREYTEIGLGVVLGTPGDTTWGASATRRPRRRPSRRPPPPAWPSRPRPAPRPPSPSAARAPPAPPPPAPGPPARRRRSAAAPPPRARAPRAVRRADAPLIAFTLPPTRGMCLSSCA